MDTGARRKIAQGDDEVRRERRPCFERYRTEGAGIINLDTNVLGSGVRIGSNFDPMAIGPVGDSHPGNDFLPYLSNLPNSCWQKMEDTNSSAPYTPLSDAENARLSLPTPSSTMPLTNQPTSAGSQASTASNPAPPATTTELTPNNAVPVSGDGQIVGEQNSATGSASDGATDEQAVAGEEDEDVGKRRRGNPGNFTGARLVAMQKGLKQYMDLKTRKERTRFWPSFMAELMAEFPLKEYPIPRSRLAGREEFVEKTPEEVKALTPKEKTAYHRSLKSASATDEELYLQMVKDWIFWQQTILRKAEGGMTGALFRAELEKKKKQVKPQFNHFVMKHPQYKHSVVARSSETGQLDRLPARGEAVKKLLAELPEEEAISLKAEYDELLAAMDAEDGDEDEAPPDVAAQRSRRQNFGSLAQEVLNIWRKLTGLNLVLLAGECIDGDADYDSCVIFSKPDGCLDMDAGEGVDFDRFSNTFLHWLKDIYTKTHPEQTQSSQTTANGSSTSASTPTPVASRISTSVPVKNLTSEQHEGSGDQGNQKSRSKKGRRGTRAGGESSMTDEETPEPSEPSDLGSGSEDEGDGDASSGRPPITPQVPIDSDGLWEKNEEGLPVLKVPMCDLTRAQQAAFTRECAMAIGLTKAVEDLEEDMRKSRKGKSAKASRYKGSKPTRKSSRIQTAGNDNDADDEGGDNEVLPVGNDDGGDGGSRREMNAEPNDGTMMGEDRSDDSPSRVIHSVNDVESLPAWAKAVVMGHSHLDIPQMEAWAKFDVQGCSTPFLKGYGEWLLGPQSVPRPEVWSVIVHKWIEVEEEWNKRNVEADGAQIKMLKSRRPQGYLQWFKYGRMRWEELVPSEVRPESLGHEWWTWWTKVVNPRWRPKSEDMVMPGGAGSWEAVRIPGKDGFVLVLVSLRWWCDLLDDPENDLLWLSTIKAVYWTLVELLKDAQTLLREDDGEDGNEEVEECTPAEEAMGVKRKR
ncbi:SERTA domain-containing protein 3 [Paramarasmius palmivorus]|uniref:SERTA domain-containing protein 3 n=1 Tax=Paramarasmius palmivorus TaxID=297713 RepID=A0AAW0B6N9_9AGAR